MYFLRLAKIKPAVKKIAEEAWKDTVIGGEAAKHMDRVLDVRQGELCWVAGTVYMDMPLKPDVLEDVTKDVSRQNINRSWGELRCPRTDSHTSAGSLPRPRVTSISPSKAVTPSCWRMSRAVCSSSETSSSQ